MRTLYLLRHAKSSWDHPGLDDFDRPLNDRGLHNAPFMAGLFKARNEALDLIITSPAARALATAQAVRDAWEGSPPPFLQDRSIYLASVGQMLGVLGRLPDNAEHVLLVGHNPGISELCEALCDAGLGDLPTAAMVRIDLHIDQWQEIASGTGSLVWSDHPKRHPEAY